MAVLMDPLPPPALMAMLQHALMELRTPLVLMERKQDVLGGPHLSVKMEQLQDRQDILMKIIFKLGFKIVKNKKGKFKMICIFCKTKMCLKVPFRLY